MSGRVIVPAFPLEMGTQEKVLHQGAQRPIGCVKRGMLDGERANRFGALMPSTSRETPMGLPSIRAATASAKTTPARRSRGPSGLACAVPARSPELLGKLVRKDQSDDLVDPGRCCFQILITDQTVGLVEAGERVRAIFHQECHQSLFESTRLEVEVAGKVLYR